MISPLRANEWELLRSLRMAALSESPDAFSPTAEATAKTEVADWQRNAARFATHANGALLIARPESGLMSAVQDDAGVGHIGAMWGQPRARGTGLGAGLLDAGITLLEKAGCWIIELSVTETNLKARNLYESRGFALTGSSEPLRPGSPLANLFMRRHKGADRVRTP